MASPFARAARIYGGVPALLVGLCEACFLTALSLCHGDGCLGFLLYALVIPAVILGAFLVSLPFYYFTRKPGLGFVLKLAAVSTLCALATFAMAWFVFLHLIHD